MNKRINVILPESTMTILDRIAPKGDRSRLIDRAIRQYIYSRSRQSLREQLKQEASTNADRDLAMAADWLPIEEEAWLRGEQKKATRKK
jgi:CopG family transcriptional regulator/antitoxin EndoAI